VVALPKLGQQIAESPQEKLAARLMPGGASFFRRASAQAQSVGRAGGGKLPHAISFLSVAWFDGFSMYSMLRSFASHDGASARHRTTAGSPRPCGRAGGGRRCRILPP
jgi:hypothetical protein